jgi:hypothetical protein
MSFLIMGDTHDDHQSALEENPDIWSASVVHSKKKIETDLYSRGFGVCLWPHFRSSSSGNT